MSIGYVHTAVGVMGVIVNAENKILLVLSQDRGWEPPMGFIDVNESLIPALEREVLEESGYEVNISRLTGIYHCIREYPVLSFCFLCTPKKHASQLIEESLAVQWVTAPEVLYPPWQRQIGYAVANFTSG